MGTPAEMATPEMAMEVAEGEVATTAVPEMVAPVGTPVGTTAMAVLKETRVERAVPREMPAETMAAAALKAAPEAITAMEVPKAIRGAAKVAPALKGIPARAAPVPETAAPGEAVPAELSAPGQMPRPARPQGGLEYRDGASGGLGLLGRPA